MSDRIDRLPADAPPAQPLVARRDAPRRRAIAGCPPGRRMVTGPAGHGDGRLAAHAEPTRAWDLHPLRRRLGSRGGSARASVRVGARLRPSHHPSSEVVRTPGSRPAVGTPGPCHAGLVDRRVPGWGRLPSGTPRCPWRSSAPGGIASADHPEPGAVAQGTRPRPSTQGRNDRRLGGRRRSPCPTTSKEL